MHKRIGILFGLLIRVSALGMLSGCVTRMVVIESEPTGASVQLDGKDVGPTRFSKEVTWSGNDIHTIAVEEEDYERESRALSYEDAVSASDPWEFLFPLKSLVFRAEADITANVDAATVRVNDVLIGKTPLRHTFVFARQNSKSPWDVHTVTVEEEDFERKSLTLQHEDAVSAPTRWEISFVLEPLVISAEVDITANVESAAVKVDDVPIGETPLRHTFVFTRQDSDTPWNSHLIVVSKDGYRYRPSDAKLPSGVNPPFSHRLTVESSYVLEKQIDLQFFEPVRFRPTKVRRPFYSGKGFEVEEEIVLSQVGEIEREPSVQSVTKITDYKPGDGFIESRISVMSDGERIIYSVPFRRPGSTDEFMNIWLRHGSQYTRLTDALKTDLEGTVTPDGSWIYFSSSRLDYKRLNLWRMGTAGRGGLTKITDSPSSSVDTEPAISPDGLRLAYTSYLNNVDLPHIWVADIDGTLPTQLRIGKSPCWSPDNKKLLFVAPDAAGLDRIWVMEEDGSNPTQLTTGDYRDLYPVWTPDGKRIVYSSDQALNEEGLPNFDLWIMNADGSGKTQLTVNGSYDTRPAVSTDGKYIYFVSNRGAQTEGQQALQIWRIELRE